MIQRSGSPHRQSKSLNNQRKERPMASQSSNNAEILARLDRIERDLGTIKLELAETRGAYRLAKFVVALLGVSGLGGLTAWFVGQGK
jgi:hypothetical protein